MPQTPATRRKVLLLVAAALVLILFLKAGMGWYVQYSQNLEATIDAKALQYEKLSRLLAEADNYTKEQQALAQLQKDNLERRYIKGATPSLSEAAFQNLVKDLAKKHNMDLRTLRALPTIKKDDLTLLQLNINSRAEIGSIRDFLIAVWNSGKFIYFSEVEISTPKYNEPRFFNFVAKLTALTEE